MDACAPQGAPNQLVSLTITSALFNVLSGSEMLKSPGGLRSLVPASDRVPQPLTLHLAVVVVDYGFNQH